MAAPAEHRAGLVRAHEAGPAVLSALASEIEDLAMTHVAEALEASAVVLALADSVGDALARASARRARAQSLAYAGRFKEALPVSREAVARAERAGLGLEAARARLAAVHALVGLARYDEAIAAAEAARAVFVESGEDVMAARADTSIGGVHQKRDDPAAALRHFDRARALLVSEPVALAQLDSNRGLALQSLDDFAGAEDAYRAALPGFEQAGMAWAVAIVENNLAVLATRQGRLQPALYHFERARRHLDLDSAPAEWARVLVEQADALVDVGLRTQALKQYRMALGILQRHGQVREAAQAQAGIGSVLAAANQGREAEEALVAAAHEFEKLEQPAEVARLNLVRAEVALAEGRAAEARALAAGALQAVEDRPAAAAAALYQLARAALAAGDLVAARRALSSALALAERLDIAPLLADVLHARGLVQRAAGAMGAAAADFRAAVEQVERVRGALQAERFRMAFHGDRLEMYTDLVTASLDRGGAESVREAFGALERAKSRALLDLVQGCVDAVDLTSSAQADDVEAALLAELGRLRRELNMLYSRLADARFAAGDASSFDNWREKARSRQRRIETLESRLSAARGVAGLFARPRGMAEIQAVLAPETALVEYFVAREELLAFVLLRDRAEVVRGLGHPGEVTEQVQRVHFQIRRAVRPGAAGGRRGTRLLADVQRESARLHESVLRPLADELGAARQLLFVPHGPLHAVPFHALWNGGRWLIEDHEVSYAPSASWLAQVSARSAASAPPGPPLVVGVPDENAPGIADEARQIASCLKDSRRLLSGEATVERVKAALAEAGLVHLACHGHFSSDDPQGSGIKLADRWLTVREIYELRLPASLVTLSACQTGSNVVSAGDELLGLTRGFLAAGTPALIVSLWSVSDKSTTDLMSAFYNQLRDVRAAVGIAGALRIAQLDLMTQRPHPAFWAPFVLIGDA